MSFDPTTGAFAFSFQDDPSRDVPDPTEIFLPASLAGTVELSDGISVRSGNQLLYYRGAPGTHEIRLVP